MIRLQVMAGNPVRGIVSFIGNIIETGCASVKADGHRNFSA
jgi:hypothetical protein